MKEDEFKVSECDYNDGLYPLSRREFLQSIGGGIIILFTVSDAPTAEASRSSKKERPDFNAYLRIAEDGRVTCFTGKVELGQGVMTSLAQTLADELDVPLKSVDMVMGDTALCPYDAGTWGSMTTPYFGPVLRAAGAEARAVLIGLAARCRGKGYGKGQVYGGYPHTRHGVRKGSQTSGSRCQVKEPRHLSG